MRILFVIAIVASLIGLSFVGKTKTAGNDMEKKSMMGSYAPVAVLELFTSEGCSSCPPADNLLPQLAKLDSNIFPLSFHVDYWNRLGWTDPFSSPSFSDRQREYASQMNLESVYTPQLVVNGEYELVGSNQNKAESIIKTALQKKAFVNLDIEDVKLNDGKLNFNVHLEGDYKKANLVATLVQKKATMNILAGENSGAKLSHINVVRVFEQQAASDKNEFELKIPANLTTDSWQLIVYAQQKKDLQITGATLYSPK